MVTGVHVPVVLVRRRNVERSRQGNGLSLTGLLGNKALRDELNKLGARPGVTTGPFDHAYPSIEFLIHSGRQMSAVTLLG